MEKHNLNLDWKCHQCGQLAKYRARSRNYCKKHWAIFLGFGKDDNEKKDQSKSNRKRG